MKMSNLIISLAASLMMSATAFASDRLELGQPDYGGNGCPAGTASVTLSPDQQALSILFDDYLVEAGGESGRRLTRKSCNIAIPVHVPQGFAVSVFAVDYRGYTYVPRGGEARFNVEYFFAGRRGPRYTERFRGPVDDEYLISDELTGTTLVWSACGADTILRANTSMLVKTNRRKAEALATVDSADVEAGLIYHLRWRRCR